MGDSPPRSSPPLVLSEEERAERAAAVEAHEAAQPARAHHSLRPRSKAGTTPASPELVPEPATKAQRANSAKKASSSKSGASPRVVLSGNLVAAAAGPASPSQREEGEPTQLVFQASTFITPSHSNKRGHGDGVNGQPHLSAERIRAAKEAKADNAKFWATIATPVLFAWLAEHGTNHQLRFSEKDDRQAILFEFGRVQPPRPVGRVAAEFELSECWRSANPAAPNTSVYMGSAPAAEAAVSPLAPLQPLDLAAARRASALTAAQKKQAKADAERASSERAAQNGLDLAQSMREQFERDAAPAASRVEPPPLPSSEPPSSASAGPPLPRSQWVTSCIVCTTARPASTFTQPDWRCATCTLRGDLETVHPTNVFLAALLASGANKSLSTTDQSEGQKKAQLALQLSAQEKEYTRLAGGVNMIASETLENVEQLTSTQALTIMRESHDGTAFLRPPPSLISLVRSGHMLSMGWALPQSLHRVARESANVGEALDLHATAGSGLTATTKVKSAPPLTCIGDFWSALVYTIIPSVIDRPRAVMAWISFARTVSLIEGSHGWAAAHVYIERLLNEAVPIGADIGVVHAAILQAATRGLPAKGSNGSKGGGGDSAATSDMSAGPCHAWNSGGHSCATPCVWAHKCTNCRGNTTHRRVDCTSGNRGAGGGSGRGGGGGSGSGRGGRDARGKPANPSPPSDHQEKKEKEKPDGKRAEGAARA